MASTNPKDKIYAVLGIARDTEKLGIQVDYERSDQDVFRDAAERILRNSDSLDILSYKRRSVPGLSSWATDWASDNRSYFWGDDSINHAASGEIPAAIDFEEDGRVLVTCGMFVDEIVFDAGVLDSPKEPVFFFRTHPGSYQPFSTSLAALCEHLGMTFPGTARVNCPVPNTATKSALSLKRSPRAIGAATKT